MIAAFKELINGPPVDQTTMHYSARPAGPDYLPPFLFSNPVCYGKAEEIAGEVEFNRFFIKVKELTRSISPTYAGF